MPYPIHVARMLHVSSPVLKVEYISCCYSPGQWGMPTFTLATGVGFIPIVISSTIESVGDYIATADACEVMKPPTHIINRGIAMEGLGSMLSGFIGTCHGTTSYSNMVGLIAYTGVSTGYRAPFQFPDKMSCREISRSFEDWWFKISHRFEIWLAHQQHCCRGASHFQSNRMIRNTNLEASIVNTEAEKIWQHFANDILKFIFQKKCFDSNVAKTSSQV